jgi:hypothetical protein
MHSALSSVQSLHFGLVPSHLDFLDRHISHCARQYMSVTGTDLKYRYSSSSPGIINGISAGALLVWRALFAMCAVGNRAQGSGTSCLVCCGRCAVCGHLTIRARRLRHVAGSLPVGVQASTTKEEAIRGPDEMRRPQCRFEHKVARVWQCGEVKTERVLRKESIGGRC